MSGAPRLSYNARAALLQALEDVFAENWKWVDVVRAVCWAQRELAGRPKYRQVIALQGWIIGKADDPHA